jgi:hypothetical protein
MPYTSSESYIAQFAGKVAFSSQGINYKVVCARVHLRIIMQSVSIK